MFTSASCVQLRRQPSGMDWEKKWYQQHPKTTSAPTNDPLSVSEPKTETKINNQLKILKEQAKQLLMMAKAIFDGGRLTHSYPTYSLLILFYREFMFAEAWKRRPN